jgi:hypothetical protein
MTVPLQFGTSSVKPGPASAIMRLVEPPAVHPYPYDVAADGRILALTRPTESAESLVLTVVTNLHTALRP